ncbi:MAG TPA: OmpA family protein [Saprospiraceae bacterium]|nr:OmpA family protein [Saprospiraceae bacterium]
MKYYYFSILLCFFSLNLLAQNLSEEYPNIVPNPSFEKYSATPIGWFYKGKHFTEVMKYWNSPTTASPDVFGPKVRVPSQWAEKGFGKQSPKDGRSMAGVTVYGCENGKPHCREYIQIQLSEALVIDQDYYVEFWVSGLPRSLMIDKLGVYFSEKEIKIHTDDLLNFTPDILSKTILNTYSGNWVKISGKFKATKEAEYLIVGNFYPDSLTRIKSSRSDHLNYAYYYLDDFLVRKEKPIVKVPVKKDDLSRIAIKEGSVIQLKNIFFDTDKAELLPRSNVELYKLLQLMRQHPNMIIEIAGHTDSVGEFNYNISLSQKRAMAVANFLNENGVSKNRTLFTGYGSTRPVAPNDTCQGRQQNRRVEFLVVKM